MRKIKAQIDGELGTIGYEDLGEINGVYRAKFVVDGIEIMSHAPVGADPDLRMEVARQNLFHFGVTLPHVIEFEE